MDHKHKQSKGWMMIYVEIAASIVTLASVVLATKNSIWTWPIGIIGCMLFGWLFYTSQLYADVTLQAFFILTSLAGWCYWSRGGDAGDPVPITYIGWRLLAGWICLALVVALAYAGILIKTTDAFMPILDSTVLMLSILGQFLLMRRHYEAWYVWIGVNILSIELYASRDLYITTALYVLFLINALVALYRWDFIMRKTALPTP
jgi:nicotinamide mononucleotide transporter